MGNTRACHDNEEIPLENFRILEDDPKTMVDFSIAIYSMIIVYCWLLRCFPWLVGSLRHGSYIDHTRLWIPCSGTS
jgi:hypothetical protein